MGKWAMSHPEEHKAHARACYARNSEQYKGCAKKYRDEHREEIRSKDRLRKREERKNNPKRLRTWGVLSQNRRRARKRSAGGSYTLRQWIALCNLYGNVCLCCLKKKKLTPDHVIPISLGGTNNIDNIQPLCLKCNMHKHTGTMDYRKLQTQKTQGVTNGSNMQQAN